MVLGVGELPDSQVPFAFEAFRDWYQKEQDRLFEPALDTLVRLVDQSLNAGLSDIERARVRISSSRVKSPNRAWVKLCSRVVSGRECSRLEDVPGLIDDIVGLRITCNNRSDIWRVQELVGRLPSVDDHDDTAPLVSDPNSEKQYHLSPKASGYRAYHINLHTLVPAHGGWERVSGELQVRTLLQDGWGELTHEDTYKPGAALPPLATTIARRMADLLATVDDLAQDLRDELERVASDIAVADEVQTAPPEVTEPAGVGLSTQPEGVSAPVFTSEVLLDETRRLIGSLSRPASLAEVADRLRGAFGSELTKTWGGFGSFKALVATAAPNAELVIDRPPGYIIPEGVASEYKELLASGEFAVVPEGFPAVLERLRRLDPGVPALSALVVQDVMSKVADVLERVYPKFNGTSGPNAGIALTNAISKEVRDAVVSEGGAIARGQVDYLVKALLFSGNLRPMPSEEIARIVSGWLLVRAQRVGLVSNLVDERRAIDAWVGVA